MGASRSFFRILEAASTKWLGVTVVVTLVVVIGSYAAILGFELATVDNLDHRTSESFPVPL